MDDVDCAINKYRDELALQERLDMIAEVRLENPGLPRGTEVEVMAMISHGWLS